ncbi:MAG: macro domain-containing protein [Gemmatimonadales bacterium]
MIRYAKGNLLEAPVDALVNTVNEVGVMGKGIALQFREAFPLSAREYEDAAKAGRVKVGRVFVTRSQELLGPQWIIHFPTKRHWRHPSQLAWIRDGLRDLVRIVKREGITSIALPPLGCGNGGLEWTLVRNEMEAALSAVPNVNITIFAPTAEYYNSPKRTGLEVLTPARALIAEIIRRYSVLGIDCSILEVQKLAWVLNRTLERVHRADALALEFGANKYGPYSDNLRHLLDGLDGSYLHCEKRLADAKPLEPVWFDEQKRQLIDDYFASSDGLRFVPALEQASAVIEGFESPLGMELIATVDWLVYASGVAPTVPAVTEGMANWPAGATAAKRKLGLFDERLIGMALDRLNSTLYGDPDRHG